MESYIYRMQMYLLMKRSLMFLCFGVQVFIGFESFAQHHLRSTPHKHTHSGISTPKLSHTASGSSSKKASREINFNGQWRGEFMDNSTAFAGFGGQKISYVLELETRGNDISGYSYTYFSEGEKHYYTICRLKGTIDRSAKQLVVTEVERTKFNTPPDFRNCFQVHKLKYNKENPEEESLSGTWFPAPDQEGDCGFGKTALNRKIVVPMLASRQTKIPEHVKKTPFRDMNKQPKNQVATRPKPVTKNVVKIDQAKKEQAKKDLIKQDQTKKDIAKADLGRKDINKKTLPAKPSITPPVAKTPEIKKQQAGIDTLKKKEVAAVPKNPLSPVTESQPNHFPGNYEKRNNTLLETINIKNEKFTVDFYDDGAVDGDSISVFYNGKLVLSKKMLTEKPITLTLTVDPDQKINELVMYAENLGEIPPNTALMIVHDGNERYEARIVSDTERNGTIRFTHNPK